MISWWLERPWWLRLIVAYGLIVVGVITSLSGIADAEAEDSLQRHFASRRGASGISLVGLGVGLSLVGGRSRSEKNGYRF